MTRVLLIVFLAALVVPAFATDSRLGKPDVALPEFQFDAIQIVEADVLICLDTDANAGFADPTPLYHNAFATAGASLIATCAVEVSGGTDQLPTGTDRQQLPDSRRSDERELVVGSAEHRPGGRGRSRELPRHGREPADRRAGLHVRRAPDDGHCAAGSRATTWAWTSAIRTSSTDRRRPTSRARPDASSRARARPSTRPTCSSATRSSPTALTRPRRPAAVSTSTRRRRTAWSSTTRPVTFKTVWSGIELSAASPEAFDRIIAKIYDWFVGTTPVEDTSWSHIKSLYYR